MKSRNNCGTQNIYTQQKYNDRNGIVNVCKNTTCVEYLRKYNLLCNMVRLRGCIALTTKKELVIYSRNQ